MKIKNIKTIIGVCGVMLFATACNDYMDINTDPNNPTEAPLGQLLSGIEMGMADTYNSGDYYINNVLSVYVHQNVVREETDQYATTPANNFISNSWSNLYLVNTDIETLIASAELNENYLYAGIGKILKAYHYSQAVDLWGDIPYSEANSLTSTGIIAPKFDKGEDVYPQLFAMLDEAIVNLADAATKGSAPGDDDLIYKGDVNKWRKLAKTLKLRMLNTVRKHTSFDAAAVNSLLSGGDLISDVEEDFQFQYGTANSPDERHPLYAAEYGGGQVTQYISPWFYEIMRGMNPNIFTGNQDPRIPYYWVNQLDPTKDEAENPTDYYDEATGFLSIRFGSIGPDRDHAQRSSATMVGMYICGGRYDDGTGDEAEGNKISTADGTGAAPFQFLTYYERLFIEAELIQAGHVTGNVATVLRNAITEAFVKVDNVVENSSTSQTVPVLSGSAAVTAYIDDVMTEFDAADDAGKMEIIMTQKWIASFGKFLDSYTDYRRTGYPVLADPNSTTGEYALSGLDDSQTQLTREYPLSMFWPSSEITTNSNAPNQKTPTQSPVFWDK